MSRRDRGDTIIEVMFSFVVFSMLAVATYMVMNRGTQIAQRSLEITLVRQQLDTQVSLIKYIKETDPTTWSVLTGSSYLVDNPMNVSEAGQDGCPAPNGRTELNASSKVFFVRVDQASNTVKPVVVTSGNFEAPPVYVNVDLVAGKTRGIFAQITRAETASGSTAGRAYDVYVSACWDSVGVSVPLTIGTVTRIYDKQ